MLMVLVKLQHLRLVPLQTAVFLDLASDCFSKVFSAYCWTKIGLVVVFQVLKWLSMVATRYLIRFLAHRVVQLSWPYSIHSPLTIPNLERVSIHELLIALNVYLRLVVYQHDLGVLQLLPAWRARDRLFPLSRGWHALWTFLSHYKLPHHPLILRDSVMNLDFRRVLENESLFVVVWR